MLSEVNDMIIKQKSRFLFYILCILSMMYILFAFISITYATQKLEEPNYTIFVDTNGNLTCSGNLFGDDLWYPGKEERGIIRIYSAKGIKITRLGFDICVEDYLPSYSKELVNESFLKNMKLSVKRGMLLIFNNKLFENQSFSTLMKNNGFSLDNSELFFINKENSIDLLYTLLMADDAGEELQNVTAKVAFKIDLEQN